VGWTRHSLNNWIGAWIDLFCTIIRILTFDGYYPDWDVYYRCWLLKRQMFRRKNNIKQRILF